MFPLSLLSQANEHMHLAPPPPPLSYPALRDGSSGVGSSIASESNGESGKEKKSFSLSDGRDWDWDSPVERQSKRRNNLSGFQLRKQNLFREFYLVNVLSVSFRCQDLVRRKHGGSFIFFMERRGESLASPLGIAFLPSLLPQLGRRGRKAGNERKGNLDGCYSENGASGRSLHYSKDFWLSLFSRLERRVEIFV